MATPPPTTVRLADDRAGPHGSDYTLNLSAWRRTAKATAEDVARGLNVMIAGRLEHSESIADNDHPQELTTLLARARRAAAGRRPRATYSTKRLDAGDADAPNFDGCFRQRLSEDDHG